MLGGPAVAELDRVPVDDPFQLVFPLQLLREMRVQQSKKLSSYVCGAGKIKWGVIPCNLSLPLPGFRSRPLERFAKCSR